MIFSAMSIILESRYKVPGEKPAFPRGKGRSSCKGRVYLWSINCSRVRQKAAIGLKWQPFFVFALDSCQQQKASFSNEAGPTGSDRKRGNAPIRFLFFSSIFHRGLYIYIQYIQYIRFYPVAFLAR
jgi:hypothetical protein